MSNLSGLTPQERLKISIKNDTNDKNIIPSWEQKINSLKGLKMTKEQRAKAKNERFLIDGFLPSGYHIVLYGGAGSGKTSIVLKVLADMLEENEDMEVFFFYVDGQLNIASRFQDYLEKKGLEERYNILTNSNAEEMLSIVEGMVKEHPHPEKFVFVLDTLKHITPDINNKAGNAKALHRIKAIINLGSTFISLHHTNKDGENFSGTAEIEQDSDGLLKIETTQGERKNEMISTIKEGGRVRFYFKEISFSFIKGDPTSVKEAKNIDVSFISKMNKDKHLIGGIKAYLRIKGQVSKTELEEAIKEDDDFDYSIRAIRAVLKTYVDIHWIVIKSGERNTTHNYRIIE